MDFVESKGDYSLFCDDWEEVLNLLEPVAYRIFGDRSSEGITQAELLPLLAQAVAEIKPGMTQAAAGAYVADLLPRLSEHSGLFLEQGFDPQSGERIFGFLHLTFAEYLAARYLAGKWEAQQDEGKRRAFLARYAHVPRWREVVPSGLRNGATLTLALLVGLIAYILINFDAFFLQFHKLFFEGDSFQFRYDDTLIRLYPEQLWSDASILIGILTGIFALVILVGSIWWLKGLKQPNT